MGATCQQLTVDGLYPDSHNGNLNVPTGPDSCALDPCFSALPLPCSNYLHFILHILPCNPQNIQLAPILTIPILFSSSQHISYISTKVLGKYSAFPFLLSSPIETETANCRSSIMLLFLCFQISPSTYFEIVMCFLALIIALYSTFKIQI